MKYVVYHFFTCSCHLIKAPRGSRLSSHANDSSSQLQSYLGPLLLSACGLPCGRDQPPRHLSCSQSYAHPLPQMVPPGHPAAFPISTTRLHPTETVWLSVLLRPMSREVHPSLPYQDQHGSPSLAFWRGVCVLFSFCQDLSASSSPASHTSGRSSGWAQESPPP